MKKRNFKEHNWYSSRYQIVVLQRNILFLFTIVAMVGVSISVLFVKQISASRSLEPYVIEIENKTGIATVVDQETSKKFTADETLKRYFIYEFMKVFEGYNPATFAYDSQKARLMSDYRTYYTYRTKMEKGNEYSPLNTVSPDGYIEVKIKSVQFIEPLVAQVRMRIITYGAGAMEPKDKIAFVEFHFASLELTLEERYMNPLGFQVIKYRIDDEILQ